MVRNTAPRCPIDCLPTRLHARALSRGLAARAGRRVGSVTLIADPSMPGTLLGYIGEGALMLDQADATTGAPIEGWFDGSMVRLGTTRP